MPFKKNYIIFWMSFLDFLLISLPKVCAIEYPIGKPINCGNLEIGAVYLQPIEMSHGGMMRPAQQSDIHLEADIHALENNLNGLPEGAWAPYLNISYELTRKDLFSTVHGKLMPMVANDGPHYGDNVKLMGMGPYHLKLLILPPNDLEFGRHTDKETGVSPWFNSCIADYDFVYAGTGKKGGY